MLNTSLKNDLKMLMYLYIHSAFSTFFASSQNKSKLPKVVVID